MIDLISTIEKYDSYKEYFKKAYGKIAFYAFAQSVADRSAINNK